MRTIYKYQLDPGTTLVPMPEGAQVLCVQLQANNPCIWASVDPDKPLARRFFAVVGTGHAVLDDSRYVGTVQMFGGALVWHIFELIHYLPAAPEGAVTQQGETESETEEARR